MLKKIKKVGLLQKKNSSILIDYSYFMNNLLRSDTIAISVLKLSVFLFLLKTVNLHSQIIPGSPENFVTIWQSDNPGNTTNTQIEIPTNGSGFNYNIYWESTSNSSVNDTIFGVTGTRVIAFPSAGEYKIEIQGDFPHLFFDNGSDKQKIIQVQNWGNITWNSMYRSFYGCSNLELTATDSPNLNNVTTMRQMFQGASSLNSSIDHWDVSNVDNFMFTFREASSFNSPLNNWNVSNATTLRGMFHSASIFNQDLSNWNVTNVTNMWDMFRDASNFNQNLGDWNVGNVTNMSNMLNSSGLSRQNYDSTLIGWEDFNLSSNVSLGAEGLVYCNGESARDQLINTYNWTITEDDLFCENPFVTLWKTDNSGTSNNDQITIPTDGGGFNYDVFWYADNDPNISDSVTGNTGDVTITFPSAGEYIIEIHGDFPHLYFDDSDDKNKIIEVKQWGDIIWTSMYRSFFGCSNLEITATDAPNLSNVTTMRQMFQGASSIHSDINHWDVSNVDNFMFTFREASSFNKNLNNWNVSNATTLRGMFHSATVFNQDLSSWDVSNVTNMWDMFRDATNFNQSLGGWDVENVANMLNMLNGSGLSIANYDLTLIGWSNLNLQLGVEFGVDGLSYCTSEPARDHLTNTFNWIFTGDSLYCHEYATVDLNEYSGDVTISLPQDIDAGPYYYFISRDTLPNSLHEAINGYANLLEQPVDSLEGIYDTSAVVFEQVPIGDYFVGAYDTNGDSLHISQVQILPPAQYSRNVDIFQEVNLINGLSDTAVCEMLFYTNESVSYSSYGYELIEDSSNYMFGFIEDTILLDGSTSIAYGFFVEDNEAKTIVNGVVSSTAHPVAQGSSLLLEKEGAFMQFKIDGNTVLSDSITADKYNLKTGIQFLEAAVVRILHWAVFQPRLMRVNYTSPIIPCGKENTDVTISVDNFLHPLWSGSSINYTLYDDSGNSAGSSNTHLPSTFTNLTPGNYNVIGFASYTTFITALIIPINVNIAVGYELQFDNFQETVYNFNNQSLIRDDNASGLSTAGATLENIVDANDKNWVDFELQMTGSPIYSFEGQWSSTPIANGADKNGDVLTGLKGDIFFYNIYSPFLPSSNSGPVYVPFLPIYFQRAFQNTTVGNTLQFSNNNHTKRFRFEYSNGTTSLYEVFKTSQGKQLMLSQPETASVSLLNFFIRNLDEGFIRMNTNMRCVPPILYAKMERSLRGVKYEPINNEVFFYYNEEYFDFDGDLNYKVYNATRQVEIDPSTENVINNYGDNRNSIDVSSLSSGDYVLEITNDKKEKFYLRFVKD